jgi:hypothetical protein
MNNLIECPKKFNFKLYLQEINYLFILSFNSKFLLNFQ